MHNYLKRYERITFAGLPLLGIGAGAFGAFGLTAGWTSGTKWLGTSGLLVTVTGVVQLEVSGLFEKIIERFGNEKEYPYGPPSHITREIIDNSDAPLSIWLRNVCFFSPRTGFWLIVIGTLVQVPALWL